MIKIIILYLWYKWLGAKKERRARKKISILLISKDIAVMIQKYFLKKTLKSKNENIYSML